MAQNQGDQARPDCFPHGDYDGCEDDEDDDALSLFVHFYGLAMSGIFRLVFSSHKDQCVPAIGLL